MRYNGDFLAARLAERNRLYQPEFPKDKIDFSSNDYLGIIRNRLLRNRPTGLHTGSGGTRIFSGNYRLLEEVENKIALFHNAEAAVMFPSGYEANVGVISSLAQKGDLIIYDALCHPSVKDGTKLSAARSTSFEHNNIVDLEKQLQHVQGNTFIFVEAVSWLDGDVAPLEQIAQLAAEYHAHLIVNESHSVGIFGDKGEGLVHDMGLEEMVFARIHSFGNAFGCHGAVVLGSDQVKKYLLDFCHSLLYSTSLSEQTVSTIQEGYKILPQLWQERQHLHTIVSTFQDADLPFKKLVSTTPIQHLIIGDAALAAAVAQEIQYAGYDVRPVFYPVVPKGKERIRIILHSFNTRGEVSWLISAINAARPAVQQQGLESLAEHDGTST